jgi:drug/metabolite transporter (DMT)-like permease
VLGLSAAVLYGAADFCGGIAAKRTSPYTVAVIAQAVGFVLLLAVLPLFPSHATTSDYLWGLAAGACGGIGIALLYHALAIGKMGVVSPITAVLAAALPVIVSVVRGERLSLAQIAGIAVALIAIVLISVSTEETGEREISTKGVKEAIAAGIIIGGFFLCLAYAHKSAGLNQLLAARVSSVVLLLLVAFATRSDLRPRGNVLPVILLSGAIDMAANALYVFATYHGYLSIAAVLTSLYPASTVFLARVVLKERLQRSQKLGVVLALAGVALIAL